MTFGMEIVNCALLLPVHDAGQDGEQEMPRLKDMICHRFDPIWEKTIASAGRDHVGRNVGNAAIIAFWRRVLFLPFGRAESYRRFFARPLID